MLFRSVFTPELILGTAWRAQDYRYSLGGYTSTGEDTSWFQGLHTYNPERAPKAVPGNKVLKQFLETKY